MISDGGSSLRLVHCAGLAVWCALIGGCQESVEESAAKSEELKAALTALTIPSQHAEGEALFEASCLSCHGPRASGSAEGPPLVDMVYRPNHHADAAFHLAVVRGVPAHHWRFGDMEPVSGVTPEMTQRITDYVRWLQRQVGID